jgi:hypothetical protein
MEYTTNSALFQYSSIEMDQYIVDESKIIFLVLGQISYHLNESFFILKLYLRKISSGKILHYTANSSSRIKKCQMNPHADLILC